MSTALSCPKCGGGLKTQQVSNIITKYCDHCGPLAWGTNVKTGASVRVKR
ncbi:zf-TFIIB domain-containing protein [Brucella intermedia]